MERFEKHYSFHVNIGMLDGRVVAAAKATDHDNQLQWEELLDLSEMPDGTLDAFVFVENALNLLARRLNRGYKYDG